MNRLMTTLASFLGGAGGMLLAFPALAQNSDKRPAPIYVPPAPPVPVPMPPAPPRPVAAELPATPAKLVLGREIAVLLNDGEVMRIQFDKLFGETMPKQLNENPAFQTLEKQYPGIIAYIVVASRPLIEKATMERAPALYDRLARIYATNLTESELHEMLDFYHSPAGKWLVLQMARGMDLGALFGRYLTDPDSKMVASDLASSQREAVASLLPQMPAEHRAALMRLAASPLMPKLARVNSLLAATAASWGNEMPHELGQQIGEAMVAAMQRYIAQASSHPAKPK